VAFREDADRRQEQDELRAAKQEGYEQGLRARERAVRRQTKATQS
jgi:ribosome modulation factor